MRDPFWDTLPTFTRPTDLFGVVEEVCNDAEDIVRRFLRDLTFQARDLSGYHESQRQLFPIANVWYLLQSAKYIRTRVWDLSLGWQHRTVFDAEMPNYRALIPFTTEIRS